MKKFLFVVVFFWMKNDLIRVNSKSCCVDINQSDYIDVTEGYRSALNDDPLTSQSTVTKEPITEMELPLRKNRTYKHTCVGTTKVTNVYERRHDVDMRYVQDSITAMWRIIFSLIFILILVVFLISYVYSLIKKNNTKKCTINRNEKISNIRDTQIDKHSQLYFPVINATRAANFLKDLDPIYDYPCSLQSDYERV